MNTESKEHEFKMYKGLSESLKAKADEHEKEAEKLRTIAQDYENKAIGLLVPYKIGDIIEFEETQGYVKKIVKRYRMRVTSFNFWSDTFEVNGYQVGKDGKTARSFTRKSFFVREGRNPFVQIVKAAS